jgi:hypothetical protein
LYFLLFLPVNPLGNGGESADWIPELVLPARKALAGIHDVVLKALIIRQYYEVLRSSVVVSRFGERLPGWRGKSAYESGRFAQDRAEEADVEHRSDFGCAHHCIDHLIWLCKRLTMK